ncbi:MAG: MFS transporter [Chloroflexota bacterium]
MTQGSKPRSKLFFGWWIVLATGLLCGIVQSFYTYGISVIFKPLAAELGFNRAVTSVGATLGRLEGGIQAPVTGWLVDKLGPKWVAFFGVFAIGLGLILVNYIQSVWAYYVVWGIIVGSGVNIGLTIPVDKTITDWFVRKRGIAMGIKFAFIGAGGIAIVPIVTWLTIHYGWRMACVTWSIVTFVSLLLVVFFVKQRRPEYYGLLPDGTKVDANTTTDDLVGRGVQYASAAQEIEFSTRQAMKTAAFWMLWIISTAQLVTSSAITLHTIPFITDIGINSTLAGFMMSLMVFFTVPARLLSGLVVDRVNKAHLGYVLAASLFLQTLGITALLFNPNIGMIYVFLILFGLGSGAPVVISVLIRARYFGRKAYGSISGISSLITTPMGFIAPIYAGWIYDSTGSYITAFITFSVIAALGGLISCFLRPPKSSLSMT